MTIAFKPVIFPTDLLLFTLIILMALFAVYILRHEHLRTPWRQITHSTAGMIAIVILSTYVGIAILDSLHFRSLQDNPETTRKEYSYQIKSVLDVLMAPLNEISEKTYAAPFANHLYVKENIELPNNKIIYGYPPIVYGHVNDNAQQKSQRITQISLHATWMSLLIWCAITIPLLLLVAYKNHINIFKLLMKIIARKTPVPWLVFLMSMALVIFLINILGGLAQSYHVFGTDVVGQDVFYQSIKSIRTGIMIGTLTTLIMLPLALILGTMAGYFLGWIDDVIQYLYTTLSSIPSVLLIAAAVLMLQVFMQNHASWFSSSEWRADVRLLALCAILGITSWTSLCRLLRGEALKIREFEYIQAAHVLGVKNYRIIATHVLPNVLSIILIAVTMDFSGLVLAEAVLSYVGVGVDPATQSFGNMINRARLELAREPMVWWSLLSAFIFMFVLVLMANIFSDVVRDAFDPKTVKSP